jgi:hypothetical protein
MEYKNEKDMGDGKEPIEKILSDLNGLLNKMPSILADIKTPDIMKKNKFDYVKEEDIMSDESKEPESQENSNTEGFFVPEDSATNIENNSVVNETPKNDLEASVTEQAVDDNSDSNFDFMASENDLQAQEDIEQADLNEVENPVRTGFPPFEAVPSVSALDKEEDLQEEESNQDSDAPDIEALMKLAENEADSASADTEQKVETESNVNLQGGVMDLNEEDKDIESGNENVQNNQDANPEVQPEVNLNPLAGNITDNEPDDEKTIIASPEDFKTMLSESSPSEAEQSIEDKSQEEFEPAVEEVAGEEPVIESILGQQEVETPVDTEPVAADLPQENIQFEATVETSAEVEQAQPSVTEQVIDEKPEGLVNNEESIADQPITEEPVIESILDQQEVETPVDTESVAADLSQENIQAENIQFEGTVEEAPQTEEVQPEGLINNEEPAVETPQENIQAEDIQFESTVEASTEVEQAESSVTEQVIDEKPEGLLNNEEPAIEQSITEEPVIESILETAEQLPQGLQNSEASAESGAISEEAGAIGATSEGLELNPSIELSSEADDEKTIVLEPNHSTFSDNAGQAEQEIPAVAAMADKPAVQEAGNLDDAEETLSDANPVEESLSLVQPESLSEDVPEEAAPDASEETIMAAPGDNPSETNRMKYTGNINELIERQVPEGIPDERIKTLVFLYTTTEESLCAEILNTMDTICLKSETKPMFIKRPLVKACEPHLRGDSAQALVTENGAIGLICIGDLPSEMIYDIENVFNSNKMFLQHINKEKFSHELIVDIVADLILL